MQTLINVVYIRGDDFALSHALQLCSYSSDATRHSGDGSWYWFPCVVHSGDRDVNGVLRPHRCVIASGSGGNCSAHVIRNLFGPHRRRTTIPEFENFFWSASHNSGYRLLSRTITPL